MPGLGIKAHGRLIQDEQSRVVDQRPGQQQSAPLAAGELFDNVPSPVDQGEKVKQFGGLPSGLPAGDTKIARIGEQIFFHGEVRVQAVRLGHDADHAFGGLLLSGDLHLQDADAAPAFFHQAEQHVDGRGLARPVRTEKADAFPLADGEADRIDGAAVAEEFAQTLDRDHDVVRRGRGGRRI